MDRKMEEGGKNWSEKKKRKNKKGFQRYKITRILTHAFCK